MSTQKTDMFATLSPATAAMMKAVMAARENAGLHVRWIVPADHISPEREWSAYAKDEAQKAAWIASKAKLGWKLI
jgi:hypothetical protein